MKILRDPTGGAGGGGVLAFDSATMAPEDLRGEPSLAPIKTIQDLAKGYVHAQKLIGAKRIAIPGQNAGDKEWSDFYNSIGRPDSPDKYEVPMIEGMDESLKPDVEKLKVFKQKMHDLGFTPKQAKEIMTYYMTTMDAGVKGTRAQSEAAALASVNSLKSEWGDKFDTNVDIANGVIRKFGGDDSTKLIDYLKTSGMGNNVHLIKLLHRIGGTVLEDTDRGNSGGGDLPMTDKSRAALEIDRLKIDKDFQEAFQNARHAGHTAAVQRWSALHAAAYPGKQQD